MRDIAIDAFLYVNNLQWWEQPEKGTRYPYQGSLLEARRKIWIICIPCFIEILWNNLMKSNVILISIELIDFFSSFLGKLKRPRKKENGVGFSM